MTAAATRRLTYEQIEAEAHDLATRAHRLSAACDVFAYRLRMRGHVALADELTDLVRKSLATSTKKGKS